MKKKDLYIRKFLNLEGTGTNRDSVGAIRVTNNNITIANCTRSISLEFDIDEEYDKEKDFQNYEYKIDTLYETIKIFRKNIKQQLKAARKAQNAPN